MWVDPSIGSHLHTTFACTLSVLGHLVYSVFTDCTLWCSHLGMVSAVTTTLHILFLRTVLRDVQPTSFKKQPLFHCMKSSRRWSMISSSVSLLSTLWSITQSYATFDCGCLSIETKLGFENQGTLAAWFLQLLTLAVCTSRLLFGGAPAHHHHWVNWKHSTLWCISL